MQSVVKNVLTLSMNRSWLDVCTRISFDENHMSDLKVFEHSYSYDVNINCLNPWFNRKTMSILGFI